VVIVSGSFVLVGRATSLPGRADVFDSVQRAGVPGSSAPACAGARGASRPVARRTDRLLAPHVVEPASRAARRRTTSTAPREAAISTDKAQSWVYCEEFLPEDDVLLRARERAAQLGCTPVLPGSGAALSVLAAAAGARAVVEIGTGAGVGSLYLLRGMPSDGVLTTIDIEVEHQRAAKEAFAEEGVRATRTRTISGRALDVLPRLTDGGYDLVFVDADKGSYPGYVEQAVRLLRPGGVLAVDNALWHDRVADPARRDETTTTIREVGRVVRSDDRLVPAMLPTGDGLLVAVRR
jgi:predicted O-methyltransferase YrrM